MAGYSSSVLRGVALSVGVAVAYRCCRIGLAKFRLRKLRGEYEVGHVADGRADSPCILIKDRALFMALRNHLVDRDVHSTFVMGGAHKNNILSSQGPTWKGQRALIRGTISRSYGAYKAAMGKTVLSLGEGTVDLFSEVAKANRAVIAEALGIPRFEYDAKGAAALFWGYGFFVYCARSLLIPRRVYEVAGKWMNDMVVGEESNRVAKLIRTGSEYPFARKLVEEFGLEEAMGHLWAVVHGSSIPEASITCDILGDLAKSDPSGQRTAEILGLPPKDYEAWVEEQVRGHVFFPWQMKVLARDVDVDGARIPAGQRVLVELKWLNETFGGQFTTGYGQRVCPGAQMGLTNIAHTLRHILTNYRVQAPENWFYRLVDRIREASPYCSLSMGLKHLGNSRFHLSKRTCMNEKSTDPPCQLATDPPPRRSQLDWSFSGCRKRFHA